MCSISDRIMAPTFSPSSFIVLSMSVKFIPSTPLITGTTNPCEDEMRIQMNQNQLYTHVQIFYMVCTCTLSTKLKLPGSEKLKCNPHESKTSASSMSVTAGLKTKLGFICTKVVIVQCCRNASCSLSFTGVTLPSWTKCTYSFVTLHHYRL